MLASIPDEIKSFCTSEVGSITQYQPASGGCINNGGRIMTRSGEFFLKWNHARSLPGMFTTESKGLRILADADCIQIPTVVAVHEGNTYSALIIEYITSGKRTTTYWSDLAQSIACLHRKSQDAYGLDHDNYIGSLPQYNTPTANWADFFIRQRLQPQVQRAYDTGHLQQADLKKFGRLEQQLPNMLADEKPALTHGDLWNGNLMTGPRGNPVLIDPAVAFVHREMELAFTTLFGGFDPEFYRVYQEIFPIEPGYEARFDIYNIYPLLVHVNLFGGGYYRQVMGLVDGLIG